MLSFRPDCDEAICSPNTISLNHFTTKRHLRPRPHIIMCHLFISYPNYICYYEFVGLPILDISVDFHRDPPVNVAYIPQSPGGSFMTQIKKVWQTEAKYTAKKREIA